MKNLLGALRTSTCGCKFIDWGCSVLSRKVCLVTMPANTEGLIDFDAAFSNAFYETNLHCISHTREGIREGFTLEIEFAMVKQVSGG